MKTNLLAKAFYSLMAAVLLWQLVPLAYHYESTSTEQRERAREDRRLRELAKEVAVDALLKKSCTQRTDVSGLYTKEFQQFTGRVYQTRHAPVSFTSWECSNGVTYWTLKGSIPDGFKADFRQQIAEVQATALADAVRAPDRSSASTP